MLREVSMSIHICMLMKLSNAPPDIEQSPSKVSFSAALGEYGASFDFGPPISLKKKPRPYTKNEGSISESIN
jgi:hypothetical protein